MKRDLFELEGGASPDELLAEARRAVFVMVGFLALIWLLEIANWADSGRLAKDFGILPRVPSRLPDILTAPFFHFGWAHIEANSGPLFIFGFLAAYRGVLRFLGVTLIVAVTSGLAVWLFQGSHQLTVGASGLIYGYFGYVLVKGLFDRHLIDVLIGIVMALSFAYILVAVVPGTPRVSWTDHLGGLIGGIASGWLLRTRRSEVDPPGTDRRVGAA
jgi:membrane associated rhomboid family serine protease